MEKRLLGSSKLEVSALGLGCWPLGGGPGWGDTDEAESIATVHAALDLGITFFDTAEAYNEGHSEEVLGRALKGRRGDALIASKISPENAAPATLRAHCEASLRRLQTEHIDLYQVHWPIDDALRDEAYATLADLQAEGKVGTIGLSNHGVQQLGPALASGVEIASNQLCYSLLSRAIEFEILPLCIERGLGVIAYMALMQGLLVPLYSRPEDVPDFRARSRHFRGNRPGSRHGGPGAETETFEAIAQAGEIAAELGEPLADVALAWVSAKPGVTCVLVGSRRRDQLLRNVKAASLVLPQDVIDRLDQVTEGLRSKLGPYADYYEGDANQRIH